MHLLFVRDSLDWPRFSGSDVHCYYMMRALIATGHRVSLATVKEPSVNAIAGLELAARVVLDDVSMRDAAMPRLSRLQERFCSYWGLDLTRIGAVGRFARLIGADTVVAVGLEVLPYLAGAPECHRIWYAADEWVWHHISMVKWNEKLAFDHLRNALIKGAYERSFASCMDRVWVVSDVDRRAMRFVTGVRAVDVIPNGVDADYYKPADVPKDDSSCVFWGGLNYAPNIQALEWFCGQIWPALKAREPSAVFRIYGCHPVPRVLDLARQNGVEIHANVVDLREGVSRNQVAVLPFVSGYGIKNKLLEAAALGMPCVCTERACNGLNRFMEYCCVVHKNKTDGWVRAILALWRDGALREGIGTRAREWALTHHSWESAAETATAGIPTLTDGQRPGPVNAEEAVTR